MNITRKAKADELRVLFLNFIGILPPVLTRLILSYIDPIEEYLESSWNEMRENLKKIKGFMPKNLNDIMVKILFKSNINKLNQGIILFLTLIDIVLDG